MEHGYGSMPQEPTRFIDGLAISKEAEQIRRDTATRLLAGLLGAGMSPSAKTVKEAVAVTDLLLKELLK